MTGLVTAGNGVDTGVRPDVSLVMAHSQTLFCQSLGAYLEDQAGIRVIGSCSSAGAIRDLVESTHPDLLVVDWALLTDGSMGLLRTLTKNLRGPSVLLLIAEEDSDVAALGMRMGAAACVLKEGPVDDLLAAIRAVAAGQMWMSPALLAALFAEYRADSAQLEAREQVNRLAPREKEVLRLMVAGWDRNAMAEAIHVSNNTVRTHVQNIEKKLKVHSVVAAVSVALQAGLRPD